MPKLPPFTHGSHLNDSTKYEVGIYTFDEREALDIAYSIIGHYRPQFLSQKALDRKSPEEIELQPNQER